VEDRDAARTVLNHCAREARRLGEDVMHFPLGPSHPFARLCLELGGHAVVRGAAHDPFLDEEMLHVVDPVFLVEELAPFFRARLAESKGEAMEATVPLVTTAGAWLIRIAGGEVKCLEQAAPRDDDARLPHWQLVQLLAGYRAADEIDPPLPLPHLEALRCILPKSWPFSVPDPDLWEAVEPPEPYSPAAAAVVKRTDLPWFPA